MQHQKTTANLLTHLQCIPFCCITIRNRELFIIIRRKEFCGTESANSCTKYAREAGADHNSSLVHIILSFGGRHQPHHETVKPEKGRRREEEKYRHHDSNTMNLHSMHFALLHAGCQCHGPWQAGRQMFKFGRQSLPKCKHTPFFNHGHKFPDFIQQITEQDSRKERKGSFNFMEQVSTFN